MDELKKCLEPFMDLIRMARSDNNPSFDSVVENLKSRLIEMNICGIKNDKYLLDKLFDEVLEE